MQLIDTFVLFVFVVFGLSDSSQDRNRKIPKNTSISPCFRVYFEL